MSAHKPPRPRFAVFASGPMPTPSTMAVDAAPRAGEPTGGRWVTHQPSTVPGSGAGLLSGADLGIPVGTVARTGDVIEVDGVRYRATKPRA